MAVLDACPSFLRALAGLLLGSVLAPLLLPLVPGGLPRAVAAAGSAPASDPVPSLAELQKLWGVEWRNLEQLERMVEKSEDSLRRAKSYVERYRSESPVDSPSNPVRDYKMMQRIEQHWQQLWSSISEARFQLSESGVPVA